jgi:hypothetical protein
VSNHRGMRGYPSVGIVQTRTVTADFDAWVASLGFDEPEDPEHPGERPVGLLEFLHTVFDTYGAVELSELDRIAGEWVDRLAHEAVELFVADLRRPSWQNPTIVIGLDEYGSLQITYNGNWSTPATIALRAPETICEIADNLRDHAVDVFQAAWPLCPTHGFGLYPQPVDEKAIWYCRYGSHAVSAIGQLPRDAGPREG